MYIKGHVEKVDTKDQSNAIVYWVWYLVCRHCRYKDQSIQCIECYVCRHCRYEAQSIQCIECLCLSTLSIQGGLSRRSSIPDERNPSKSNVDTVDYEGSKHTMHWMLCLSTLSIQGGLSRRSSIPDERNPSKSNVNTVDTKQVHPVFEMFYSKEREISEMFYSKEREISRNEGKYPKCSTQKREKYPGMKVLSTLSIQGGLSRKSSIQITLWIRSRFIRYSKCSTQKRREISRNEGFVNTVDTRWVWVENLQYRMIHPNHTVDTKQVHPVFKMFYSKEREISWNEGFVNTVDTRWFE